MLGLAGCAASVGQPPSRPLTVLKHEAHQQCPLSVGHPSVMVVRSRGVWAKMMAEARAVPPPYDATATDFGRFAVLVVGLPATPAPTTDVALAGDRAVSFLSAERRIEVTLRLTQSRPPPGTLLPTVVGSACMVIWVETVGEVLRVTARTVEGKLIAEH